MAAESKLEPYTLIDILRSRAASQGHERAYTFLVDGETAEESLTYEELDRKARAIGAVLQSLTDDQDRVLLLYPPGLEYIAAFFGCCYAGRIAVPVYPPRSSRTFPRLKSIIEDAQAKVALTTTDTMSRLAPLLALHPDLKALQWQATDNLDVEAAGKWRSPQVSMDTLAFLQYTSGSTSDPKGVMISHGNLIQNERMIQQAFRQTNHSIVVGWLPLYHDMGLIGNVLQTLYAGARCILMSPVSFLQHPLRWLQAITRYKATTSGGPNFAYDLCVRKISIQQRAGLDLSSWSLAFNGSEPVNYESLDRFVKAFEPYGFRRESLVPCYGLAEATLFVSGGANSASPVICPVNRQALENNRIVTEPVENNSAVKLVGCGRAWLDQKILIVDPQSSTCCPPDTVGEVWMSGSSVARGYWNRYEESKRYFEAYLADTGEGPYARTGDLGFIKDGELFITGRLKDLIIIRGRNYYPQDIELTAERSQPGLRPGCCAAFSIDVSGEERLVVVQEVEREYRNQSVKQVSLAMRQSISEEHELQMYAVTLVRPGTIPKTSSGKIQRHACRAKFLAGELDSIEEWRDALTPVTEASAPLAQGAESISAEDISKFLVSHLALRMGVKPSDIDTNQPIAHHGVDSLMAVEMMHSLETALGVLLPMADFFYSPSIAHLASQAHTQLTAHAGDPKIVPAPTQQVVFETEQPLSYGQQALWFLHQIEPESPVYNITGIARVRMELDISALERIFQTLVERHPSLRTTFTIRSGEPVQHVHEHMEFHLQLEDACEGGEAKLSQRLMDEACAPFNLEKGPLLKVKLFKLSEQDYRVILVVHHMVCDFWSLALLISELGLLYRAEQMQTEAILAPLTLSYTNYSSQQARMLAGPEGESLYNYWQKQLADAPQVLDLPSDRSRPPIQTYRGASCSFRLSADLTLKLKALSRAHQSTLYMTLLSAFQTLLYRYTGQEDLLVGSPTFGRNRAELVPLVGYLVNPLVMRAQFYGSPTFEGFLESTRRDVLAAFEHQNYPFALLVERLQPVRDPSRSPLFQFMFTLQQSPLPNVSGLSSFALGEPGVSVEVGALVFESIALEHHVSQFDMTLMMAEEADTLAASLQFNKDIFDAATAERLAGHFQRLLDDIFHNPWKTVSDLLLLTRSEELQLLVEWNDTGIDYPQSASLNQVFEAQVERVPDTVALIFKNHQMTYRELNRRSNQLAHRLSKLGVGPDVRVGICLERSLDMMIAVLGVLKAGGAYVPLDPAYPRERLGFMLDDAQVAVLLTQRSSALSSRSNQSHKIQLDTDWNSISTESEENFVSQIASDNIAYVIYTSGSTGRPKGVMVPHSSVVNFFAAMDSNFGDERTGTWLAVTSLSFDISVLELLWTLARGFRVVIQAEQVETADAGQQDDEIAAGKIDFSLFYFANDSDEPAADKYELLIEGAKFADQNGFLAVWTPERHFHAFGGLYPNPSLTGAVLAAITDRIHIRAGSVVLPLHNSIRVAEEWAFVDNISKGRVGVSFASGWHASDFVLAPENYASRKEVMMGQLETVRQLWRGEAVRFKDGVGNDVDVVIRPRPIQPLLPVWITSAGHPDTFRAAGEAGANLLTHLLGQSIEELAEKIAIYRKSWRKQQAGPQHSHVTLMLHTFVDKDIDSVREKVQIPFCNYLVSSFDLAKGLLRSLGQDIDEQLSAGDIEALLLHSFNRYYETSGLFGTPDTCLRMVNRLKRIGVDEIACLIDFGIDARSVMSSLAYLNILRQCSNSEINSDGESYTLPEQIIRHNVTHLQCTPSLARALTDDPQSLISLRSLDNLLLGGEAFPTSLGEQLRESVSGEIHNMYGPTETTIWSTTHRGIKGNNTVLIGRPIANTQTYVSDQRFQLTPTGVPGEVLIGGDGVVRGYLNRPDLTAERFIPDTFGKRPGARLYRTGDLARYATGGDLEFLGRLDNQVKVRGYRIELAEIEETLRQHPDIREAVIVASEDRLGDLRLIAYLVPSKNGGSEAAEGLTPPRVENSHTNVQGYRLPNGLVIRHHGGFQTSVIFKEVFEDEIYFQHGITLGDGDCIFDVGANIGLFTLFVHRKYKGVRVYAFEPIPPNFELLSANLTSHAVNAKLFNCGLADRSEAATFTFYPQAAGLSGRSSSVEEDKRITKSIVNDWLEKAAPRENAILSQQELSELLDEYLHSESYTCRLRTLSDILRENDVERIDLLKIDVEGSELDVLAGIEEGDWNKIKQIVIEIHSIELLNQITALLEGRGYNVVVGESVIVEPDQDRTAAFVCMLYAIHPNKKDSYARPDQTEMVSYLRPDKPGVTIDGVRAFLKDKLPAYMVPAAFVLLDALPLTPNGKIDRRALPDADSQLEQAADFVAPQTPTERALAEIWADILGRERLGIHDNFFDVGGHSLMATQLVTRIRTSFSVDMTLRDFLKYPTISSIAVIIEEAIVSKSSDAKLNEILGMLEGLEEDKAMEMLGINDLFDGDK